MGRHSNVKQKAEKKKEEAIDRMGLFSPNRQSGCYQRQNSPRAGHKYADEFKGLWGKIF